jgi:hypothetical protein
MDIINIDTLILLINNLNEKVGSLITKVDNIENRLSNIENQNNIIDERTNKLDYHIDFTVQVYNIVKKPMDFFTNALNKYIGMSPINLPDLNYITYG